MEAIKNFSEEGVFNYFNNFYDNSQRTVGNYHCTFNPLDKLIQSHEQQIKLYERLVQAENDKVEYIEKLLRSK